MSATLAPPATTLRDPLLQPLQIGHLRLRNRIMSTSHAATHDVGGMPMEKYQRYHEEKAKGGIALTMFGGSSMVAKDSSWGGGQINVSTDDIIPYLKQFSGRIPRAGGGADVPDLASGAARHVGGDELAADAGAVGDPRATASRRAAGDGPRRYRPHHRAICRGRVSLQGRRVGRRGNRDRRPSDRAVPLPPHQPAQRRIRRQHRQPRPLRHHGA